MWGVGCKSFVLLHTVKPNHLLHGPKKFRSIVNGVDVTALLKCITELNPFSLILFWLYSDRNPFVL